MSDKLRYNLTDHLTGRDRVGADQQVGGVSKE